MGRPLTGELGHVVEDAELHSLRQSSDPAGDLFSRIVVDQPC